MLLYYIANHLASSSLFAIFLSFFAFEAYSSIRIWKRYYERSKVVRTLQIGQQLNFYQITIFHNLYSLGSVAGLHNNLHRPITFLNVQAENFLDYLVSIH